MKQQPSSSRFLSSIIIVNYNSGHFLTRCIASILTQANELIIIDNASSDNSLVQCLAKFSNEPSLKIIKNTHNSGFAAACNLGYHQARYDNILFLNPDCQLEEKTLNILLTTLHSHSNTGMVGGLLLNTDGSEQQGGRRAFPTPWRAFVRAFGLYRLKKYAPTLFFDFHLHQSPLPKTAIEVEAISGACMLVKRQAIKEVGLWDEGYFLHCEDLDLCMCFHQKNWRIIFEPKANIHHALGICSKKQPFFVEWHKHKGMLRFYRKFYQSHCALILSPLITLGVSLRLILVMTVLIKKKLTMGTKK